VADEILYAGIADLTTTEILSGIYLKLLADRNALPNHPAIMYVGDAAMKGSKTWKVSHLGLDGYDKLAQTADGATVANTALTDGSSQVSVARYSKAYEGSDMARFLSQGVLNPQAFALDAVVSSARTLVDICADVVDGFTATVGTSGSDFTFDQFLEAVTTLEVGNVQGPLMSMFHGQQVADLRQDLANTQGGAVQWNPATQEQLRVRPGDSYRGNFLGVDIFASNEVKIANAGADRAGAIWGRGALLWGDMSLPNDGDPNQIIIGGKVLLERDRTAKAGLTAFVTHRYIGASMGIDAAGVSVITDA
jgi:hypothetical protein